VKRGSSPFLDIAQHFRAQITDGTLVAGDRLPTIRDISFTWNVARQTATRAIEVLRNEGLVTTGGRAGTVVAETRDVETIAVATNLMVRPGVDVRQASEGVALELGVAPGSWIVLLQFRAPAD
jgi:DNA-binding GntR family transcriptional regulator